MQPNQEFTGLPKSFWANIRLLSQEIGYTERPKRTNGVTGILGPIKVPTLLEIQNALKRLSLSALHLVRGDGRPTSLGKQVIGYFEHRAHMLNRVVEPLLMTAEQAAELFERMQVKLASRASVPMNKQSAEKKRPAYFTGLVNMLIESSLKGLPCDYSPQELTVVTQNREPFRTLARRIDGAFPGPVDPIAIWEIKEYYYTTTFGSRVADGVYETLLDGMELEELATTTERHPQNGGQGAIRHLLMVDAHFTWWVKGRSYLCRIIDMLHMGYVSEVLFGREVVSRLPTIAKEWAKELQLRRKNKD